MKVVEQAADLRVGKGDLANIRIEVTRSVRFGRVVGAMRIVEVRPQEERRASDLIDPPDRVGHDFIAAALESPRPALIARRHVHVPVEALCQPAVGCEHHRRYERSRAKPVSPQRFR